MSITVHRCTLLYFDLIKPIFRPIYPSRSGSNGFVSKFAGSAIGSTVGRGIGKYIGNRSYCTLDEGIVGMCNELFVVNVQWSMGKYDSLRSSISIYN